MEVLRKYGVATTILFPLIDRGAQDFENTPVSHASGDTQISKNEAAFANTSSGFVHEGNGIYSLALTATEMEAARIAVTIIDQGTKEWEDQAVIISTYGGSSAQHLLNTLADFILKRNMATARASSDGDGSGRFVLQALSFIRNKKSQAAGTLTVTQEDDSTADWTAAITTDSGADPITALDPS